MLCINSFSSPLHIECRSAVNVMAIIVCCHGNGQVAACPYRNCFHSGDAAWQGMHYLFVCLLCLAGCKYNQVNSHFHCIRDGCLFSFLLKHQMTSHSRKHMRRMLGKNFDKMHNQVPSWFDQRSRPSILFHFFPPPSSHWIIINKNSLLLTTKYLISKASQVLRGCLYQAASPQEIQSR